MRVLWRKQLDVGGEIEACPQSWLGCGLNGTLEGKRQIGAWPGHHYGCAVRLVIRREGKNAGTINC